MNRKIGRNDPCPCGSGKKYKNCCQRINNERKIGNSIDSAALIEHLYANDKEFREESDKRYRAFIKAHMPNTPEELEMVKEHQRQLDQQDAIKKEHQKRAEETAKTITKQLNETSLDNLQKRAENNDLEAQALLGFCYYEGRGVVRDYAKAFEMFKKAADGGNKIGISFTKMCYMHGVGVKQNFDELRAYPVCENDSLAWSYYTAGYYDDCINLWLEDMEGYLFQFDDKTAKNEKELAFYERYERYKDDLRNRVNSYEEYLNAYLSEIKPTHITDDMLINMGFDVSIIEGWKKTNQINEHKRLWADYLSVYSVTCQYYNDLLEDLLDQISDISFDFEITRAEKQEKLDRLWFSYDMYRNLSYYFIDMCDDAFRIFDIGIYKQIPYINKKTCTTKNISLMFDVLRVLSFPYDFRACRLLFDLYRLGDDFDKAEWTFIYLYDFIYHTFARSYACVKLDYLHKAFETPITFVGDKISIERVLQNTIRAISFSVDLYDYLTRDENFDENPTYYFLERPTQEEIWAQGIGSLEAVNDKNGKIRNLHFAMSNSLPILDFMIEALMYIFKKEGDGKIGLSTIGDEMQLLYSDLKSVRQDLIERVYKNAFVYDSDEDREKLSIAVMERTEDEIELQMNMCDAFMFFANAIENPKQIDKLLVEKKNLLTRLKTKHPKTLERLEESMDKASLAIRKVLTEGKYNSEYLDEIDLLLEQKGILHDHRDLRVFRTALASGEFLYHTYICEKEENKEFDYSFIAVQYYTALESLLKKTFYEPYIETMERDNNINELSRAIISTYFPIDNVKGVSFENRNGTFKLKKVSQIELGPIGRIFANKNKPNILKEFLLDNLNVSDERIIQYGGRIEEVRGPRNKAAHGNETVSFNEAIEAKEKTFDMDEVKQYRGLILEFLTMTGSR